MPYLQIASVIYSDQILTIRLPATLVQIICGRSGRKTNVKRSAKRSQLPQRLLPTIFPETRLIGAEEKCDKGEESQVIPGLPERRILFEDSANG